MADDYSQLIKQCTKAADLAQFSSQCISTLNELRSKQEDARMIVDELEGQWEQEFRDFEDVIEEKKCQLIQLHKKELDDFDRNIPSELPPKYQKHTPEYITLRNKQKALARNQDFAAADRVKRQADKLEAIENAKQTEKLQEDLMSQRNALIEKHNRQVKRFAQWVNEKRDMMLSAKNRQMEGSYKRLEHYSMLVESIEKKGLPPNPTNGLTTNRVSRNESIRAVRTAAQTPLNKDRSMTSTSRKGNLPFQFRPPSSMSKRKNQIITPSKAGRR